MLHPEDEAIQADVYIDSLLRRSRGPSALAPPADLPLDSALQRAIEALSGLPRFHPSFAFEESLAARLRHAAEGPMGQLGEVIRLPAGVPGQPSFGGIDRRLLVGGAIASGVSIAGIAGAFVWRQRAGVVRGPR